MSAATPANGLFQEFAPATAQEWEAAIKASLKGADYEKALFRKTYEGITTHPFYTRQDQPLNSVTGNAPGQFPYLRGTESEQNTWHNCPGIGFTNAAAVTKKLREALTKGATAAELTLANATENALAGILGEDFGQGTILLHQPKNPTALAGLLKNLQSKTRFVVTYSPFTLANPAECAAALSQAVELHKQAPEIFPVTVNGAEFYNNGGNLVQELAFTLSALAEIADKLTDAGHSADQAFAHVHLRLAVGTNYFFEIAKLRALRLLYAGLLNAFGAKEETATRLKIQSVTAGWHQTLSDPYTNLLRATTEAMSAVIGGTQYLTVLPHTSEAGSSGEFSERIARNISLILEEEAYLGKAIDPAAGAYYLEALTAELAEAAWMLFQQTEAQGGFLAALQSGFIGSEIEKTREAKLTNLATRKELLIGTNQFANLSDSFPESALKDIPATADHRASSSFDLLRLRTAAFSKQNGGNPKVHLLLLGTSSMRKARADFAQDFFALAGFEPVRVDLKDQSEMPPALAEATCIVLCAADEDYPQYLDTIADTLKATGKCNLVLLAGNPSLLPTGLQFNGIDGFIYTGANAVEVLTTVQLRLGIV